MLMPIASKTVCDAIIPLAHTASGEFREHTETTVVQVWLYCHLAEGLSLGDKGKDGIL